MTFCPMWSTNEDVLVTIAKINLETFLKILYFMFHRIKSYNFEQTEVEYIMTEFVFLVEYFMLF